jgi:hypothetical protein
MGAREFTLHSKAHHIAQYELIPVPSPDFSAKAPQTPMFLRICGQRRRMNMAVTMVVHQ